MQCMGCYKELKQGYCLGCRKKLFEKLRMQPVLPFKAPVAANLDQYKEHTRRLSISGVQLKYSLLLEGKELKLTDKGGTFILKPIPPVTYLDHVAEAPENEHLTMQIASQVFGIHTAENALVYFADGTPAYLTKRFDIAKEGGKFLQEDFAQLSSRSSESHGEQFKYDGTYEEIGLLIRRFVAAAVPALEAFFRTVVFNYVFSNGDAHLKNFSLMRISTGEYTLTPAYDLMCTLLHTPNESDTALKLYERAMDSPYYAQFGHYGRADFLELAKRLGIQQPRAERMLNSFPEKKVAVTGMINGSFFPEKTRQLYQRYFEERLKRIV